MGIKIVDGRDFCASDTNAIILNKLARDKYSSSVDVGKCLMFGGTQFPIVGICDNAKEFFVKQIGFIQFRMECQCKLVVVTYSNDTIFHSCQNLYVIGCGYDIRCADESHRNIADSF